MRSLFLKNLIALILIQPIQSNYIPPEALVEPLRPVGIRISIPHEKGISLVAFHIKVNEKFNNIESGTISVDIIEPKYDRWTFEDRTTELKENDVIYYWIYIVYNGLGYNLIKQEHKVKDCYDYYGQQIESCRYFDNDNGNDQCKLSVTKLFDNAGESRKPCAGQLLFEDYFKNFSQFKRKHWTIVQQFSSEPDYEFVFYRNARQNLNIQNGLRITPTLLKDEFNETFIREGTLTIENCTGRLKTTDCHREARGWNILPPISSARINTKNSINFQYGRVEIRAQFPQGDWIYPLLALEPDNNSKGTTLKNSRIRIASSTGNSILRTKSGNDISGHKLWGGITGFNQNKFGDDINEMSINKYNEELWSKKFHVYEIIWSSDKIILKVDGNTYNEREVNLPENTPFYLTLGLAVGGLSEFPDDCISGDNSKPWRNVEAKALFNFFNSVDTWERTWKSNDVSLLIDYVKIWAL